MATATNVTTSSGAGATVPLILDGTGLSTSIPLLVKNGKSQSGIEVQITGGVGAGHLLRDSVGTLRGIFGLAGAANDWVAGLAANDLYIGGTTGASPRSIFYRNETGDIQIAATSGTVTIIGQSSNPKLTLSFASGAILQYSTNTVTVTTTNTILINPLSLSNSNSLTAVSCQISGDPNTGVGQIGGADTVSQVAGGVEATRASATLFLVNGKLAIPTAQTQATIGANGAAAALTVLPLGYIKVDINGTAAVVPYYNA